MIYAGADYLGIGFGRGKDCQMNIEMGSTTTQIADKLEECGAVKIRLGLPRAIHIADRAEFLHKGGNARDVLGEAAGKGEI